METIKLELEWNTTVRNNYPEESGAYLIITPDGYELLRYALEGECLYTDSNKIATGIITKYVANKSGFYYRDGKDWSEYSKEWKMTAWAKLPNSLSAALGDSALNGGN